MALPEAIPIRYTEEEAGYVSFRPVVRQTFRLNELLDMVLTVTGKEPERIRQILRSGTVVFHFYRYWWEGFEVSEVELAPLLARFPDPDPSREFQAGACNAALVEGDSPPRVLLELDRAVLSHRRLLRRRSFWDALLDAATAGPPIYHGYSYARRADLYQQKITAEMRVMLIAEAATLAPKNLRRELRALDGASHIVWVCPRNSS